MGGLLAIDDNNTNTFSQCKQDTTVGISNLGFNVSAAEVEAQTTAQMQARANWTEPAGATVEAKTVLLPDRDGDFYDFFTVWLPPVASTSRPSLRQWYT